ncbi:DUF2490 domain-containing protein [Pontibacter silvestris]|uniref:DUF2490 domain-containing protein n=1 Tax=Pontibacter silvestris TaxID=2305183 RepID=A0ABW4WW43_9BACT|nr:DUF2490 domain-containing protein [Pontibacter silvestris]MCC9137193.1 DUF2490 domain-containing protein [Pontibacter silvestris]
MKKIYFVLLLVLPMFTQAQSKVTAPMAIWPEIQINKGVGEDGVLFLQNQYRVNTDERYNDLKSRGPLRNFERVQLALGYEQTFSDHWRGGALFRYALEDYPITKFYTLFLRHNGNIGGLYFNKQAMFEYVSPEDQDAYGRYSFMAELGKRLSFKSKFVSPSVRYEAMLLSDFGDGGGSAGEERTVDRTRLRISLNYELNKKLRINPYFMRQTDYYFVLIPPRYDENSQLVEKGYTTKRNRISPVVGLEVKYSINKRPNTASFTY